MLRSLSPYQKTRLRRTTRIALEWLIILLAAWFYGSESLLNFDPLRLQETGEHNESSTFPILTEIAINRYGQMPLWNAYTMTGIPYLQDPLSHLWHLPSTIPILLWGAINGMKVSIFLSFILAGLGQWLFAHVLGARGLIRLWTALLFMFSGGLAFFWAYGWYELLLGAVWFPWCFAALWWALRRRDWTSMILTAFCIVMVLTTGGGYYPFYLLGCLATLTLLHFCMSSPAKRWRRFLRAILIALMSAGLLAVVFAPVIYGLPLLNRWTADDREQTYSQPIPYALMHYVISDRNWEGAEVLGLTSGWKWFYIGAIPVLAALSLAPLAWAWQRRRRVTLIAAAGLTLLILAWVANRYSPFGYIYDLIPYMYNLRFPNRLLVLGASPLIVLGGLGLSALQRHISQWRRTYQPAWATNELKRALRFTLAWLPALALIATLAYSTFDSYQINQAFAFGGGSTDERLRKALTWLKDYDKSFYYINLGGDNIYWHGVSVSYQLEMPVINFDYGRRLASMDLQMLPESPFIATAKYVVSWTDPPMSNLPPNAQKINSIEDYHIWYLPDALPAAFSAPPEQVNADTKLPVEIAAPLSIRYDGPNRVIVQGAPTRPGDQLVALVSDYPGWELSVDGTPASLVAANGYLGSSMSPGEHTYTFEFKPKSYMIGLAVSTVTLLVLLILIVKELPIWHKR